MRFEFLPAFSGDCFLIHAGTDDEPVLILVDGGPRGTYQKHLRSRLMALREERGLDDFQPLVIDLVIVSHVDDNHINGIIDLFEEMRSLYTAGQPPMFEVRDLWHNSFDQLLGSDEVPGEAVQLGAASFASLIEEADDQAHLDAGRILQSVSRGHNLRNLAKALQIPINGGFGGLIQTSAGTVTKAKPGGIKFTVIGPRTEELAEFQAGHDSWLRQAKMGEPATPGSLVHSLSTASVANLFSIVLLVECGGRTALLTGNARSDSVLAGLETGGLIRSGGSLEVDLLKMPHQGSDRHVDVDFLQRVTAPRYVFSGNGEHGNPERETLRMLAEARPDAEMEIWLTYRVEEIDRGRRDTYERQRLKALKTQSANKVKQAASPPWSAEEHSLFALLRLYPNIRVVEPNGAAVELDVQAPASSNGPAPPPNPPIASSPTPPIPPPEPGDGSSAPPRRDDAVETYTEFVSDDAEAEIDALDRGVLAISLARQLHRIWRKNNGLDVAETAASAAERTAQDGDERAEAGTDGVEPSPAGNRDGGAFVLHLDAPWGGGKTTFAHFVARVLNPYGGPSRRPPQFLTERYGPSFNLGKLFIEPEFGPESRRPWITVWFNAWQAEDCQPPWWVFYQAIRQDCFDAIRREGDEPLDLAREGAPLPQPDWERAYKWRRLMRSEYWWRIRDPKIVTPFAAALISTILAVILWSFGAIAAGASGVSFALGNGFGFVLAAVTGIGALWGIGTFVTESVAPGTNSLAERLSLGSADPFRRFRDHFVRTMEAVRRPVMVIVDDLDRCKPEFIVNLMRGIQILLRSPRIVFVILGDRDWIERAFEKHHEALSKVSVGPEQSLGARFVEKTIQMSFILPGMARVQETYVRRILGSTPGEKTTAVAKKPEPELVVQVRDAVKLAASQDAQGVLDSEALRDKAMAVVAKEESSSPEQQSIAKAESDTLIRQLIDEEVAIHVSADESAERETIHLLQELAPYFPPNPRQIKRIVNAMTTYRAMAMHIWSKDEHRRSELTDPTRLTQLAIWVTLMTEWPETWRLLASCPDLADAIGDADNLEARLAALPAGELPGSVGATVREIRRIRQNALLRGLITGEGREGAKLDSEAIRRLFDLTPLYRGRRSLGEADEELVPARRAPNRPAKGKSPERRL